MLADGKAEAAASAVERVGGCDAERFGGEVHGSADANFEDGDNGTVCAAACIWAGMVITEDESSSRDSVTTSDMLAVAHTCIA